jgi:hypothetical protein
MDTAQTNRCQSKGTFTTLVCHNGVSLKVNFLVIEGKAECLLSYSTAETLGIVKVFGDNSSVNSVAVGKAATSDEQVQQAEQAKVNEHFSVIK